MIIIFQENYFERIKRQDDRKKASVKSPVNPEQKSYREKVKEFRSKEQPSTTTIDMNENSNQDREPELMRCNIPLYDIKLFQEAQAIASEKIVSFLSNTINKYKKKLINFILVVLNELKFEGAINKT